MECPFHGVVSCVAAGGGLGQQMASAFEDALAVGDTTDLTPLVAAAENLRLVVAETSGVDLARIGQPTFTVVPAVVDAAAPAVAASTAAPAVAADAVAPAVV